MTGHDVRPKSGTDPQRLLTRPMVLLMTASVGSLAGFSLLLSVVPLYVATAGAGEVGAGLSTGVMMLSTVLVELAVPRLLAAFGHRAVMAAGLVLLGAPAAVLVVSPSLPLVLGVCLARGAGFGIVVVTGTTLAAELAPPRRRAEALGLYGVAMGGSSVLALPAGVWLSDRVGFDPVFVAAAALSLVALAAVSGLPARRGGAGQRSGVLGGLRTAGLTRPALALAAVALAAGVLVTFLPLAVADGDRSLAAGALLLQAAAAPLARWGAGRFGDRHGSARLLVPAVLAAAIGTGALVRLDSPFAVLAGMGLFGVGFGLAQNATLALMFERVPRSAFGQVSALWNIAFDGGMGIGAVGFGLLIGQTGYSAGFAVTAAVLFAAVGLAWRDTRSGRGRGPAR